MDIYKSVTDTIIRAIEESPDTFQMPWTRFGGSLPQNGTTNAAYHGVNVLNLWCEAQLKGFSSNQWASYKQWSEAWAQVRKGERSSLVVFYKTYSVEVDGEEEERRILKWSYVFNADQVDGWTPSDRPEMTPVERLEAVERFITGTGAIIKEGGNRACYIPTLDEIHMPDSGAFLDTESRTRTEAWYGVLLHELTHYSGHPSRLNRDLTGRFGSEAYADEELIAELGSAFLCAKLNITPEPRADHAHYIANWLQALKNDKKYIFSASARAQEATQYLLPT